MNYKHYGSDSSSRLVRDTQRLHNEMIDIYNEQVRQLQVRITVLEDKNKLLRERLARYENENQG